VNVGRMSIVSFSVFLVGILGLFAIVGARAAVRASARPVRDGRTKVRGALSDAELEAQKAKLLDGD
jgi:hypothetical protein